MFRDLYYPLRACGSTFASDGVAISDSIQGLGDHEGGRWPQCSDLWQMLYARISLDPVVCGLPWRETEKGIAITDGEN